MAAVTCGTLRRVRHKMARIYLFLPSSSTSTSFKCFLHPKSFHSLSCSYLCLHPKSYSTSQSSHPKYAIHSFSSYLPSIHPPIHLLSSQSSQLSLALLSLSSPSTSLHSAPFSTSPLSLKTRTKVEGGPPEGKKKQRPDKSEIVTLIDTEDKVSAVTLENAERLAKRRDLKLVKVEDPNLRAGKRVYKLMTGRQYFEEEMKARKDDKKTIVRAKDEKTLVIGGKISPYDLGVKLQNIIKWLSKGQQVKVTIMSKKATKEDIGNIFSEIEKEIKKVNGRVMQRHEKGDDIRFYIVPPKDKSAASEEASTDDSVHS